MTSDDVSNDVDETEWPSHCPLCGTELESHVIASAVTNDWNDGSPVPMLAEDVCPNADCPGKETDMAEVTGPDGAQP